MIYSGFNIHQKEVEVILKSDEAVKADPQILNLLVHVLLVKKDDDEKTIRVDNGTYVQTGQNYEDEYVIVTVRIKQICVWLEHPSVQYFMSWA